MSSPAAALAGWSNHDSGGGQGDFFSAFPGAVGGNGGQIPYQYPGSAPFSPFSPVSPGNLFAQHQDYALRNMGASDWGHDQRFVGWDGPTPGLGSSFFGDANHVQGGFNHGQVFPGNHGGFGSSGVANGNDGGWFGKEGQKKMQQMGVNSPRASPRYRGRFLDDDEEWQELEDDWERPRHSHEYHDETDWDLLDDFDNLTLGHSNRRRRRSGSRSGSPHPRQRRHSMNQIYNDPYSFPYSSSPLPSPFYQLSNLSNVSSKSPRRSFLNIPLPGTKSADPFRPRPLSWRANYSARTGLLSKIPLPSLLKSPSSTVGLDDFHDPVKRILHPYLAFSSFFPNFSLSMDLRMHPRYRSQSREARRLNGLLTTALGGMTSPIHFLHLPHSAELTKLQLRQPACTPPVDRMRLFHPRLPWYIDVVQSRPGFGGVTVGDVILQLWMSLQTPVRQEDYGAEEMDDQLDSGMERKLKKAVPSPYGMYSPGFSPGFATKKYGVGRSFISRAWSERCMLVGLLEGDEVLTGEERVAGRYGRREKAEMAKGVKRVDWLGAEGMTAWIGLQRSKGGIWEIKTQNLH